MMNQNVLMPKMLVIQMRVMRDIYHTMESIAEEMEVQELRPSSQ